MTTTLKHNLEHKISQRMIQSINVLQMNSQKLTDYIKQISYHPSIFNITLDVHLNNRNILIFDDIRIIILYLYM